MKVGDLVKVKDCPDYGNDSRYAALGYECDCFFCSSGSNRIGVVFGPAPRDSWNVMFDTGMWRLDNFDEARGDVEVINESR